MYDIIIVGAGIAGASLARKASEYAKTLLIEAKQEKDMIISTNIFAEHNKPFLQEVDYSDSTIFPHQHEKMNYLGSAENGVVDSEEFGAPFGHIIHTEELVRNLYQNAGYKGATVKFGEKISKIENHGEYVELINNKGDSYKAKFVVLATGSSGFDLQRSAGFETPDTYQGIFTHLRAPQDVLESQMPYTYIFHINPKISTNGPFFFEKGFERIPVGFLGNSSESPAELLNKLDRILKNYKLIQPFVKDLKRDEKVVVSNISKHPIKQFSRNKMVVIGEAAGLVTSFFYEGMLCGVCSADIVSKMFKQLLESD
ncbi:MAG: FAD-dependent oxidoreductase, partial [Promethearchaeota archaeon]